MDKHTLLIELGTEELPPKSLKKLSDAFTREIVSGLMDAELIGHEQAGSVTPFATPRRLAITVPSVISAQPDQIIERRGPALQAAFNSDGETTPAALGFANSCGVNVADLKRTKTDKGEWLSYSFKESGKTIAELISEIIDTAIKRLPIPKRMRWGTGTAEFVRPMHWLIIMHGDQVIPATILDVPSSNVSRGHRFHCDGELSIDSADNYESILLEQGHVVASFTTRQSMITEQVADRAAGINGHTEEDQALLDEVTGLVEYPAAVLGRFDVHFLDVPPECLISSMRDHQKYFHVLDSDGKLLPNFITISNIESSNPERVQQGNERVLRARLSDAMFFWETDQKTRLENRVKNLDAVLFHIKLGTILDKTKRLQSLAVTVAEQMNGDTTVTERGALLAKADLVSDMVNEFDELQGIMGHYYANQDGEPPLVGECIEQHYWPRFAGDKLPETKEAQALALADKLDSLVGIYAAGEIPTGDKDPYALRRAALSILRILIEQQHPFDLSNLVAESADVYSCLQNISVQSDTQTQIVDFIRSRLMAYYQAQGITTTTINAVMACNLNNPLDFEHRIKAVHTFSKMSEATDLASANKRISNILKKQDSTIGTDVNESTLIEIAEQSLHKAIISIEQDCMDLFSQGNYTSGLQKLATLRTPVDNFFENVMVMSDDAAQKHNRLALLKRIQRLFLSVADISLLQAN